MSEFDGIYKTPTEQLQEAHQTIKAFRRSTDRLMNWFVISAAINIGLAVLVLFAAKEGLLP